MRKVAQGRMEPTGSALMRGWMRSVVLLTAAAASGAAVAADLSLVPFYKAATAPSARAAYDWNGFYLGGHIGGAWDHRDATIFDSATGAALVSGSTNAQSLTGGAQLGLNYMLSRNWMIGIEADISAANMQSTAVGAAVFGSRTNKIDDFGTLRGRVGYAWNNVLIYGTGGFAWAHETLDRTQQIGTVNLATPGTAESASNIGTGWAAGAGIEYGLTPNWTARVEYLHLGISPESFQFPLAGQRIDSDLNIDVVRAGVNYRFGWGK